MTAGNSQRTVLVLGKSRLVLGETVAALRDLGYTALATNDFFSDIASQFDVTEIDLVIFGTQVPAHRQAELREQIGALNPRVIFVDGLAGIPGLIVNQVQGAFAADRQDPAHAPAYTSRDRLIRLTLTDPVDVKVTIWWRTPSVPPDLKSDSRVLLDGRLASGDHTIPVPERIPRFAFATVQVGAAIYAFSITAE